MSAPRPLNEEFPLVAATLERLEVPSELSVNEERRLWNGVLAMRRERDSARLPRYWLPAFVTAAATAGVLTVTLWQPAPRAFTAVGALVLVSRANQPPLLSLGTVRGNPSQTPARLTTPHSVVEWSDARFLLEVTQAHSVLSVESGEVHWRPASGREQVVAAGSSARSPEPQAVELPPGFGEVAVPHSEQCQGDHTCLERAASGVGLAAQNALFELGRYADYLQRFPQGVLAPEASLGRISSLVREQHFAEALAAARLHETRFPDVQVHALRLALERHEALAR